MNLPDNVMVIPPKKVIGTQKKSSKVQKTRVAAYCRVSTDYEEQESSYETQVKHYTSYINSNPEWELAGIFADDGISGTNTKKRDEFNRMIGECRAGHIDMILTKSISRFSRNTVDCLKYTRELKAMNIAVYFEKENINTLDAKGEVFMIIMAALAQQESESLSANVRLGLQFRNQQGKVQVNYNRFLGYTKDKDGKLVIVPEEAAIVKRIYAEYLDGSSLLQIKRGLEKDGIKNGAGNSRWWESNLKQILTNEKYIGDAILQKTVTTSLLEKKRERNNGIAPKYYVKNSQPAIIDRDVFLRVQAEMERRADLVAGGKKRVYSSRYALSGMVFCGHCGDIYRRVTWCYRSGEKEIVWRCVSRVEKNKSGIDCPARTIKEEALHAAIVEAVNDAWSMRDTVIPMLKKNVQKVLKKKYADKIKKIDKELKYQQEELLAAGRDQGKIDRAGEAIHSLQEERDKVLAEQASDHGVQDRIDELTDFLEEQTEEISEYTDLLVRRLIEKVVIYDEKIFIKFKSGLETEVDA